MKKKAGYHAGTNGRRAGLVRLAVAVSGSLLLLTAMKGCASMLFSAEMPEDAPATVAVTEKISPFEIKPRMIELTAEENYTAIVTASGGTGPYSFFVTGRGAYSLSVIDPRTARLALDGRAVADAEKETAVAVMDGKGKLIYAPVSVAD